MVIFKEGKAVEAKGIAKKAVKGVENKGRCAAKTKAGTRCKKPASGRSKFCSVHVHKKKKQVVGKLG